MDWRRYLHRSGTAQSAVRRTLHLAGRRFHASYPEAPNLVHSFTWDGKDAYGRTVYSRQALRWTVGLMVEQVVYLSGGCCAVKEFLSGETVCVSFGCGLQANLEPDARGSKTIQTFPVFSRTPVTVWAPPRTHEGLRLGGWDARGGLRLGGWQPSIYHVYDGRSRTLLRGDGTERMALVESVETLLGYDTGVLFGGDIVLRGGMWAEADGTIIMSDWFFRQKTFRLFTDGGTEPLAYDWNPGDAGSVPIVSIRSPVVAQDGTLYAIADGERIVRHTSTGAWETVAGGGSCTGSRLECVNAVAALDARLQPVDLTVTPDGTLAWVDGFPALLLTLGADGQVRWLAGTENGQGPIDEVYGKEAGLYSCQAIAAGPDSTLYTECEFSSVPPAVLAVAPNGWLRRFAGGVPTPPDNYGDGLPARQARAAGTDLAVAPDGTVYLADYYRNAIRAVGPNGIIRTVVGGRPDTVPTRVQDTNDNSAVAAGPNGQVWFADRANQRIFRVGPSLPGFGATDFSIVSEDGAERYVFDSVGRHVATLDERTRGTRWLFEHNSEGLLVTISDGNGNTTVVERDAAGNAVALVGPYGARTALTMDGDGNLARLENPAGEAWEMAASTGGLLEVLRNPRGNESQYTYDGSGRVTGVAKTGDWQKTLTRNVSNSVASQVSTAEGRTQIFTLANDGLEGVSRTSTSGAGVESRSADGRNGRTVQQQANGLVVEQRLDSDPVHGRAAPQLGELVETLPSALQRTSSETHEVLARDTDGYVTEEQWLRTVNGRTSIRHWNALSRQMTRTSPEGRVSVTTLDPLGRPEAVSSPGIEPVNMVYDTRGRLVQLLTGSGVDQRSTVWTYDALGRVETVTDAENRVRRHTYDAADRVIQQEEPDGRLLTLTYDANGNVTSVTPPGRDPHAFTYTPLDLEETYLPPDVGFTPRVTTNVYDRDGQLTRVIRPDGRTVAHGYDSAGRLSTVDFSRGQLGYEYHPTTGRVSAINAPESVRMEHTYDGPLVTSTAWSAPVNGNVSFTYDADFRVATRSVNGANTIAYSYDNDGLLTQAGELNIARDAANGRVTGTTLGNVTDAFTYTGFGEVAGYSARFLGTTLFSQSFIRDKLGRITTKTETVEGVTTVYGYGYDLAGRLTEAYENGVLVRSYTYDDNGNRLSKTTLTQTITADYDGQDRLLRYGDLVYTWTNNGEMASKTDTVTGDTTAYTYDEMGNLVEVVLPDGQDITYVIDGMNRRIGKRVDGVLVKGWLYEDQLRIAAELDGSGNVTTLMVYSGSPNSPDYVVTPGGLYRALKDQVGTPRRLVEMTTGAIAQRLDVDEFGVVLADTPAGFQPNGFAGGLYDGDTGLVRFGARDYDAVVGRWASKDPLRFDAAQEDLYCYAENNPVNVADPAGQITGGELVIVIPAALIALVGIAGWEGIRTFIESRGAQGAESLRYDAYYHCLAQCRVSTVPIVGPLMARLGGDVREGYDFVRKRRMAGRITNMCDDLEANDAGRDRAHGVPPQTCEETCQQF